MKARECGSALCFSLIALSVTFLILFYFKVDDETTNYVHSCLMCLAFVAGVFFTVATPVEFCTSQSKQCTEKRSSDTD